MYEYIRAMMAVELRGHDVQLKQIDPMKKLATMDTYLAAAQMIMESSFKNYRHPAENLDKVPTDPTSTSQSG
jgi:hypothetical protein